MHSSISSLGGDLKTDTVTIIGATLDLQEKVVKQVHLPRVLVAFDLLQSDGFQLDYDLLKKYASRVKKIIGILLVKHCVLLDPGDSIPLRKLPLNKVPFVPNNESLLGILDKFQEGRSPHGHRFSFECGKGCVRQEVAKRSLTQRLRERVGIGDSSDSSDEENDSKEKDGTQEIEAISWADDSAADKDEDNTGEKPKRGWRKLCLLTLVLTKKDAEDFLQVIDPAINPLGIITLEDVLEELIGEEIYDEFDPKGAGGMVSSYVPTELSLTKTDGRSESTPDLPAAVADNSSSPRTSKSTAGTPVLRPLTIKGLGFFRSKSAPPSPRDNNRNPSAAFRSRKDTLTTVKDHHESDTRDSFSLARPYRYHLRNNQIEKDEALSHATAIVPPSDVPREARFSRKNLHDSTGSPIHNAVGSATPKITSPSPSLEGLPVGKEASYRRFWQGYRLFRCVL
ncbi:hypothetical protein EDC04DRAFT_2916498 [Pisolithus marmoratus]|nr:hypothetical protein EDC04DRAFT_2916498 [Pisolithus marmoratus]